MLELNLRVIGSVLAVQIALGCGGGRDDKADSGSADGPTKDWPDAALVDASVPGTVADAAPAMVEPGELVEDRSVYEQDDLAVRLIHLTVTDLEGLEDVNDNVPGAQVEVLLQEGDFGRDADAPNGTLRLRGDSTREARQKSYRIKLHSETELWRGHRVIHLNKHPYDFLRVRQKLSFDYFKQMRHLASLRTSFVRLFINGEDMGFYTQIEKPDERFLAAHGLDPGGQLYKAEDFRFQMISEDEWADPEALEEIFEIKGTPDHDKLRAVLAAIHDDSRDIDEVIDTYFQRDNYLTWWAMNVLMGNFDTTAHNYLLYSPASSQRWYFMQWDYDDSWGVFEQPGGDPRARYQAGVGNWWFSYLHQRFLRKPGNLEELTRTVNRLADEIITPRRTAELLARYHDIVRDNLGIMPDVEHLFDMDDEDPEETMAVFEEEYARLAAQSERFRQEFFAVMERPMPVWLREPEVRDGRVTISWPASYDLQGDGLTYDLLVSRSPRFEDDQIVLRRTGLETREVEARLPAGEYFARVVIRDDANPDEHWQHCANLYDDGDEVYWGLRPLTVR